MASESASVSDEGDEWARGVAADAQWVRVSQNLTAVDAALGAEVYNLCELISFT